MNKASDPIIFEAIENADLALVKHLVELGADIEKQGWGYQTPALLAASAAQWEICLYLLNRGADASISDFNGLTIPYLAFNARILPTSYQGRHLADVKEYLIKHNLDVLNIAPGRVRELKAAGTWPPKAI